MGSYQHEYRPTTKPGALAEFQNGTRVEALIFNSYLLIFCTKVVLKNKMHMEIKRIVGVGKPPTQSTPLF
jgi:hypothetical protein